VRKIYEDLFLYGFNLKAWKEAHPKLVLMKKEVGNLQYQQNKTETLKMALTIPILSNTLQDLGV